MPTDIFQVLDVIKNDIGVGGSIYQLGLRVLTEIQRQDPLNESKNIGTYVGNNADLDVMASAAYSQIPDMRVRQIRAHQNAQSQLDRVIDNFRQVFARRIRMLRGMKPHMQKLLIKDLKDELRKLYYKAFEIGLKGSAATLSPIQTFSGEQKRWIDSAWTHELRYFNEFMDGVVGGTVPDHRIDFRVKMYMDTLKSVYESARTLASHPMSVFYWIMKHEAEHCSGCLYLRDHSPYTKDNLPTTPKSGIMQCLSNCKCTIRVMVVTSPDIIRELNRKNPSRESMIRTLNYLKNTAHG